MLIEQSFYSILENALELAFPINFLFDNFGFFTGYIRVFLKCHSTAQEQKNHPERPIILSTQDINFLDALFLFPFFVYLSLFTISFCWHIPCCIQHLHGNYLIMATSKHIKTRPGKYLLVFPFKTNFVQFVLLLINSFFYPTNIYCGHLI